MEKNFTLLKTWIALCDLLLRRSTKRNFSTGNKKHNGQWSVAHDLWSMVNSEPLTDDNAKPVNDEQNTGREKLQQVNDELANHPYKNEQGYSWRERVNDDLAACSGNMNRESSIVNEITTTNTVTTNDKTKTCKNDPARAGSFSFMLLLQNFLYLLLTLNTKRLMKKMKLQPVACSIAFCFMILFCSNPAAAQPEVLDFDFTGTTTFTPCNGDGTYASNAGDETITTTDISAGATLNSITVSADMGKSGGGFGSGTVNLFLNNNLIGTFGGLTASCNTRTVNDVDLSFFNVSGPNTISFTSSGSGTRRLYNATITIDYTPCTPPPAPEVPDESPDYCFNEPADELTATGSNLLWYTDATGGVGSTNAPVPSTDATGITAFYVSQTVGCESDRTEVDVTVHPLPVSTVAGFTNVSCYGGSDGTITIAGDNGTPPYLYSIDNGLHWTASDDNPYTFTGLVADEPYEIRVQDSNGCESMPVQ